MINSTVHPIFMRPRCRTLTTRNTLEGGREHFTAQSAPSAPRSQNRPCGIGKRECVLVDHEEVGMRHTVSCSSGLFAVVATLVGVLLAWPMAGAAQTVTGEASGVQATVLGTTTVLSDTGPLESTSDARDASLLTVSIPSTFDGEVLHAVTIGWPDQVASEASLANLGMTVGGTGISADFVMASALAVLGVESNGSSIIANLSINGTPIQVTGDPNQTIAIPGGQVVINEQTAFAGGTTVNALHATVFGVADVVIASATAGIQ